MNTQALIVLIVDGVLMQALLFGLIKKKKPANKCLAHVNDGTDSFQRTWFDDILMG